MNIVLVEADYLDDSGDLHTLYIANAAFTSGVTDTPANQAYDDFISSHLEIISAMDEVLNGATSSYFSTVRIINKLSAEKLQGNYSGQEVRIYYGDRGKDKAAFNLLATVTIDDLVVLDANSVELRFKSFNEQLTEPLQTEVVGDRGNKLPISYGNIFNAAPIVKNASSFQYAVHDGAVESITTRQSGVTVSSQNQLLDGELSFSSSPIGQITADISTNTDSAKSIILDILGRAGVSNYDLSSLDTLPTYKLALYLSSGESAIQALDAVVNSVGFFWNFRRNGQFYVGAFELGDPVDTLYPDDIQFNGLQVLRTIIPAKKIELTYNPNWTIQTSFKDTVDLEDQERFKTSGDLIEVENASVVNKYPNAEIKTPGTLISNQVDALQDANRRATLLSVKRRVYQVKAFDRPFRFELGQTITIHYPFLDFANGKDCLIVGVRDEPLTQFSVLEVFC